MSIESAIFDQCDCPSVKDKHGRRINFHDAASELDDTILEAVGGEDAGSR